MKSNGQTLAKQKKETHARPVKDTYDLTGRVAVIPGGAGLLGRQHAAAIAEAGGIPVLLDIQSQKLQEAREDLKRQDAKVEILTIDITKAKDVEQATSDILKKLGRLDILINNAAIDPKVTAGGFGSSGSRLENFSMARWDQELAVGLTGAFLCAKTMGTEMANRRGGVILNICSDLAVIAPDQSLYRQEGLSDDRQPVKPVTYSVIKTALVGLTRYLATYWAGKNVRVNALSPGGMFNDQPEEFVKKFSKRVPLGRMAQYGEYKAAVLFLVSDASSYMTGNNLIIDGGRSVW